MDQKLSPGLCIATKCSIVDLLGPLFYMSAKFSVNLVYFRQNGLFIILYTQNWSFTTEVMLLSMSAYCLRKKKENAK